MKKSSCMDIESESSRAPTIQFGNLGIGDVFRLVSEGLPYMVVAMLPDDIPERQGVNLRTGGRRIFNIRANCVQVKMTCSWVDMQHD